MDQSAYSSIAGRTGAASGDGGAGSQRGSNSTFAIAAPKVELPKGGGAIRGIGEKFGANPVTGTASMTVPIATSPGRGGFGPQLSLAYDSGSGNGPFGFGWSLNLPHLTRKTDKGLPQYDDAGESDVFMLSGAEDLVPVLGADASRFEDRTTEPDYVIHRYRPRIEGLFARIERWTRLSDGDVHWRSLSPDNVLTIYGKDPASRIADPFDARRVFSWLICEARDDKGNVVLYEYKPDDGEGVELTAAHQRNRGARDDPRRRVNRYIKRIRYGNRAPLLDTSGQRPRFATYTQLQGSGWMFEVVFDYGEHDLAIPQPTEAASWFYRADAFSTFRAGFEIRTGRRCRRVLMFHHFDNEPGVGNDCLVRSTDFIYGDEPHSFIRSVTSCGYRRQEVGYLKRSMPPVEFEYSAPVVQDKVEEVDAANLENLPAGFGDAGYQWIDLHGEGIPGVLTEQAGAWYYSRNVSPASAQPVEFAAIERVASRPNFSLANGQAQLLDLVGDGQPDLVVMEGLTPGFHEHDDAEGWGAFRPFAARLNRDTDDINLRFVDLDGDGHADVLITEDDAFVWHASLAKEGFGPAQRVQQALNEESGPRLVFAEPAQSICLGDMTGDGLVDLVRIRNGEVCYWPNLGYGRFGAKVTMDQAPYFDRPDSFDLRRIRLADIDGDGAIDLIYLDGDGATLYFNQSSNSWSAGQRLAGFPAVNNIAAIQVADLKGNGTACLVWSSPLPGDATRPMRYVDLMGGQKPHLLVRSVNNLGAETVIHYATSTKFYLADKLAGKPWITKLPFPVQVVEQVDTFDRISGNLFITRYAYHHGHFDGAEREFRGFGMVEQWDTEQYAALDSSTQLPDATNIDASSNVPPVMTRTWFHTGVYLGRESISNYFAGLMDGADRGEYYREPALTDAEASALLLDDTIMPFGLSVEEEREACRALKGAMLRQEIYALDGSEQEPHPYTVSEQNFTIRVLQPKSGNCHAVFLTHAREAIAYHYERNPSDPRIAHTLTLEVDDYGNVLKSAAVGYGRRQADAALSSADQARQSERHVTCSENAFTNAVDSGDAYRTPMPSESRGYELGLVYLQTTRLGFDQLLNAVTSATALAYEETLIPNQAQKRLIEHVRTQYRPNDLGEAQGDVLALLPPGEIQSLALSGESYRLAFTPELIARRFGDKVTEGMLADEGRYVHSQGDANWWLRSGRVFLSPGANDDASGELAHARRHFFQPHRFRDPFHGAGFETEGVVVYDAHDLTISETRDALGNVTTAVHDYRALQPRLMTDPNGNCAEVAFDALGLVVGTAVMGKDGETKGDSLLGFTADLDEASVLEHLQDPLADPHAILQLAGTRMVYDLFAYLRSRDQTQPQPVVVCAVVRETHDTDLVQGEQTRIQLGLSYSDGFGREIQRKARAEPGPLVSGGAETDPRWIGSGWTIFNNKGNPVRKYEPFFSGTHAFEFARAAGVSPVLFYDPAGRVVATLHPNHTWMKVVFDPWRQESWDVNDTVIATAQDDPDVGDYFRRLPDAEYLPSWHVQRAGGAQGVQEQAAAMKAAVHAATPTVAHMDSLRRTFLTVVHNKFRRGDASDADPSSEEFIGTRVAFDVEGNQLDVIDGLDRIIMHYDYDMLGNPVHWISMEAGDRWKLNDVAGAPLYGWDSRDHQVRTRYDALHRPTETLLQEGGAAEVLVGKVLYGEGQADAEANNLRGKVYQTFDGAGVVTTAEYDFKGNLLRSSRQLAVECKNTLDWSVDVALEPEIFTTRASFDALNRPVTVTTPDNSIFRRTYNEAGLLEAIDANLRGETVNDDLVWKPFVSDIDYNSRGQRQCIEYHNGVSTSHEYDPLTFRLKQLRTLKGSEPLQDLFYAYDPAGNITGIRDEAQQTIYFRNSVVEPNADYTYDAIYQLIETSSREHIGQLSQSESTWSNEFRINLPHPNDGQAMRRYTEQYEYDAAGNILLMIHQASGGNWTRAYSYAEASLIEEGIVSNRLSSTQVGSATRDLYGHDSHGNMIKMPHLPLMRWNPLDQLQATARQVVIEGTPETTYYVYDAGGQRVRKVTERAAGSGATPTRLKQSIYLGSFEIYREYGTDGSSVSLERESLHLMDGPQRVALVETRTRGDDGSAAQLIRYQLGNHLGSASLELDEDGLIISCEEYYAYGSTSYQAVDKGIKAAAKRYRYTGKEEDGESGLYYYGARYLAPWLGRWCSVDPVFDTGSRYRFSNNSPVTLTDQDGRAPVPPPWGLPPAYSERACQLVVEGYMRELGLLTAHEMSIQPMSGGPGLRPDSTVMTGWRSTWTRALGGQLVENRGFIANEWKMPDGTFTDPQLYHDVPKGPTIDSRITSPKHAPEIGRAPGNNIQVTYRVTRVGPPSDPLGPLFTVAEEQAIARGSTNPLLLKEMDHLARTASEAPPSGHWVSLGETPPAATAAAQDTSVSKVVASAPEVPSGVQAKAAPSATSRLLYGAAEMGAGVAKLVTIASTVVGADREARGTVEFVRQNDQGVISGAIWGTTTFVVGVAAGVVDDAFAAKEIQVMGAPMQTMHSWEQHGAGPIQHAAGEAIRGFLGWSYGTGF